MPRKTPRNTPRKTALSRAAAALLVTVVAATTAADAQGPADLQPRRTLTVDIAKLNIPAGPHELRVKFRDPVELRVRNGTLHSRTGADLTDLFDVLAAHDATLAPLITLPQRAVQSIERRAAQRSRRAQPDLLGMMRVRVDDAQLPDVARALDELAIVEAVWLAALQVPPPCDDIPPTTPLYRPEQDFLDGNPGLTVQCAQFVWNARGAGIRIADCEYGLNIDHEDLCDIVMEPGQTIHPEVFSRGWHMHGTAVAGILNGLDNAYGVTGIAPQAELRFFSEWTEQDGLRRVDAIAAAVAALGTGDVLLLEMQAVGPGGVLGPAEFDLDVWMLTRTASDAGILVIAPAGNGGANLDSAPWDDYMSRGDSGAIMVGAGSPTTAHNRRSSSNYGSRVNVQGWGNAVFTSGYGNFATIGGDPNQRYRHNFNGTSSASAMIAGTCAAIQSAALNEMNTLLTPTEMRDVLIDTGWPQGDNLHIGPFPHVVRALEHIGLVANRCLESNQPNACAIGYGNAADVNGNGIPDACEAGGDVNGDGVVDVFDLYVLLQQWGPCPGDCTTGCGADMLVPDCVVDGLDLAELIVNWD